MGPLVHSHDNAIPSPTHRTGLLSLAWSRIWELINPQTEAEAEIVADQIRLTRGTSTASDLLLPVAAGLVALACRNWVDMTRLLTWIGSVAAICIVVSMIGRRLDPLLSDGVDAVRHAARLRVGMITVFIAGWCAMAIFLWVPGNATNHMFIELMLACSLAAASSMLAVHPASVAAVLAMNGGMLVLRPALSGEPLDLTMAGLGVIFCLLMTGQVRAVYAMAKRARELEFERHAIIRDLKRAKANSDRERARASEAGRAKSRFLSNLNHELRTPMNAILGFSELIKSKAFGDMVDKYAEYAEIIHGSGQHLLVLINDMLDLAKIEGGKPTLQETTFAVAPLIRELVGQYQARAETAELMLALALPPCLPQIDADERAVRHILDNLLSNAIKFTPPHGHVTVSAKVEHDGRMALMIEDDGIGIEPEDQLQVFERFGRSRADVTTSENGTGLGLAIVKGFAEAHDGEVTLESEPGIGTRVTVYLPAERVHAPLSLPRLKAG